MYTNYVTFIKLNTIWVYHKLRVFNDWEQGFTRIGLSASSQSLLYFIETFRLKLKKLKRITLCLFHKTHFLDIFHAMIFISAEICIC